MAKKISSALGYDTCEKNIVVPTGAMQQQRENEEPKTEFDDYTVIDLSLLALMSKIKKLKEAGKEINSDTLPGFTMIKAKEITREESKEEIDKGFEIGE